MLKIYRLFILPKSFLYPNSHISLRAKKVRQFEMWLLWVGTVLWVLYINLQRKGRNALPQNCFWTLIRWMSTKLCLKDFSSKVWFRLIIFPVIIYELINQLSTSYKKLFVNRAISGNLVKIFFFSKNKSRAVNR